MHGQLRTSRVGMAGLMVMAVGAAVALSSPVLASGPGSGRSGQAMSERAMSERAAKAAVRRADAQQRRALEQALQELRRSANQGLRELNGERRDFCLALEDLTDAGASSADLTEAADSSKASMEQGVMETKEGLETKRAALVAGLASPLSARNQERLDRELGKLNERLSQRLESSLAKVDEKLQDALAEMDDDGLGDDPPGDDGAAGSPPGA